MGLNFPSKNPHSVNNFLIHPVEGQFRAGCTKDCDCWCAYMHMRMHMHMHVYVCVRACICSHVFVCTCVFECKTEYLVQPSTHAMAVAYLYKCICTLYNVPVWLCGMLAMDFSTLSAVHYKGTVPTVALDRPVNTRSHDFKSPLRFISLAWGTWDTRLKEKLWIENYINSSFE